MSCVSENVVRMALLAGALALLAAAAVRRRVAHAPELATDEAHDGATPPALTLVRVRNEHGP